MDKQSLQKIILRERMVSVYVDFKGPITSRTLKMAIDTRATYTMIPLGLNFLIHLPAFIEFYQKIHSHV